MKLYLLSQDRNRDYDTYDSIIVCAENPSDAKSINPLGEKLVNDNYNRSVWATNKSDIKCEEIGTAKEGLERGVIITSFNAG